MTSTDLRRKPRTIDGRQIMLPSTIGDDQEVQFSGSGDDITNGIRCGGSHLQLVSTTQGENVFEWQYIEWIAIGGGRVKHYSATFGDCFNYEINAPATVGVSNPGGGWFDKYNLGGEYNMFVPNATQTGDWDLNLEETLNENVLITKVNPVIAADKDGFFDWNQDSYEVSVNSSGEGGYYLFDFEVALTRIINAHHIKGDGGCDFIVPASYSAKTLLPHYIHKVILNKTDTTQSQLTWEIFLGRMSTTP